MATLRLVLSQLFYTLGTVLIVFWVIILYDKQTEIVLLNGWEFTQAILLSIGIPVILFILSKKLYEKRIADLTLDE